MVPDLLQILPDAAAAAVAAARLAQTTLLRRADQSEGPVCLVLAGGTSPQDMYERLAEDGEVRVPWSRVHILWGDERCVPPDDSRSNYRMALHTGLLARPWAGIHRMPGELEPEEGAVRYQEDLRTLFPHDDPPRLSLVVLGLGEDGHIASLTPGSAALGESERWVVATAPYQGTRRLTLTLSVLASAERLLFLVTGEAKAEVVCSVLAGDDRHPFSPGQAAAMPARVLLDLIEARYRSAAGSSESHAAVAWIMDRAAASLMPQGGTSQLRGGGTS